MPYIGNIPAEKYASFDVQHFTTSATTGYTLSHAVANENDIRLVINNVVQQPGSSYAYTASGTTLTLSSATSGTDTMYCVFLGKAVQTVTPPAGSVTESMISASNSPTNGYVLSAQSGAAGGLTWAADAAGTITAFTNGVDNRLVTATSATALNGESTLTYDGTNLDLADSKKIRLGTGNDLEMYHDGSNSYLKDTGTGSFVINASAYYIRNASDTSGSGIVIDASSNVGIGEETPLGKLHVKTADSGATVDANSDELVLENSGHTGMTILSGTANTGYIVWGDSGNNAIGRILYNHASNYMRFDTNASEAMRIDTDGRAIFGGTTPIDNNANVNIYATSNYPLATKVSSTANTQQIGFNNGNGHVGGITTNGSATAFNTSSDYRLKENVNYSFDATTRLKQLKPARFNFIIDETNTLVDGFIAHEVSSVIPEAISGEKDAMHPEVLYTADDELPDGKNIGDVKEAERINPQGIDQSKLVPLLTKALQEAITKIETLEAKVTALENA